MIDGVWTEKKMFMEICSDIIDESGLATAKWDTSELITYWADVLCVQMAEIRGLLEAESITDTITMKGGAWTPLTMANQLRFRYTDRSGIARAIWKEERKIAYWTEVICLLIKDAKGDY